MKTLIRFVLFSLLAAAATAANVQIRDLTLTTVLPAANDYTIRDGTTNTTTKTLEANKVYQTATRTTLAGLSVTNVSTGIVVQTQGGSAVADGNSSIYYYNSASSATPDGVNVIQPTVGSGRWLILKRSTLPFPSVSTLGGVFSKAAVSHQFLTSINTDGTIGQAQPAASDISGIGSMATQNSSAVVITGGTIDSTVIGATTPAAGTFTFATVSGSGSAPNYRVTNGTVDGRIGSGFNSSVLGIGTVSAHDVAFYRNNSQVALLTSTGLNATVIGATTPAAGTFTTQTTTGNGFFGNLVLKTNQLNEYTTNGLSSVNINYDGYNGGTTQFRDTIIYDGKNNQVGYFTGSTKSLAVIGGINSTTIGATTPSTGVFSTMRSTGEVAVNTTLSGTGDRGLSVAGTYTAGAGSVVTGFFTYPSLTNSGSGAFLYGANIQATMTKTANSILLGAGLRVATITVAGSGTMTTAANLYVEAAPSGGTSNYAIYSAGGNNVFAGGINSSPIGASVPSTGAFTTLSATGTITTTTSGIMAALGTVSSSASDRKVVNVAAGGYANPAAYNTDSNGDKINLFSGGSGVGYDARIGVGANGNMWFKSVAGTVGNGKFEFYGSDTNTLLATISSTGLTVTGGISQTGVFNVRTYGAKGDGSTNDTTAIATAKTAAVSYHGTLYFPAGTYITDPISVSSAAGLTIEGDGMGVSVIKKRVANTSGACINVSASNHVVTRGLTFDGNCSTRTAGGQAVVYDAVQSSFCDNEIINSGEYAFFAGSSSTQIYDLNVSRNLVRACYADGINFQYVTNSQICNNIVDGSDDDCIALGYNSSGVTSNVLVEGNFCQARNDLGTVWGRGILAENAVSCQIVGNYVTGIKQSGIFVNGTGGSRAIKIQVVGNYVYNCSIYSGHSICVYTSQDCTLEANTVDHPVQGNCIEIADWTFLTIKGGMLRQGSNTFCRGIHADEGTGWSSTTWTALEISDVSIQMIGTGTSNCVYLSPNAANSMDTGSVSGIRSGQSAAGDYIYINTSRAAGTWKLGNNITLTASRTVNPSSSTGAVTVFNNF